MKKFFAFAIAAVTMTVGCQKFQDLINPNDKPVDDGAPVPVMIGTNVATVSTKAAVNDLAGLNGQNIYVYGINNEDKSLLVNNYAIGTPTLTDNSVKVEGQDVTYGIAGETYSFYGYYAGTALLEDTEASYSEGVITVPVTIDGTQDLMIGLTDKAADLAKQTEPVVLADLYGAKSARRGVKPNLVFEHMLVRFDFEFDGSSIEPTDALITVQSVSVATKTKGNLVITHGAETPGELVPDAEAEAGTVSLGNATTPLAKYGTGAEGYTYDEDITLMVMPQTSYEVKLMLQQGTAEAKPQTLPLAMSGNNQFKAGKKYAVRIKVYGMEAVIVDVTVKEWGEGGAFEYDPDEDENPVYIPVMGETETIDFTAEASSQSFMFDAEGQTWTITKSENAEWLTVDPESEITANGKVIFTATANEGEARSATVTITTGEDDTQKTKTVTINQAAPVVTPEPGE